MEENAQLRADKMLQNTISLNNTATATNINMAFDHGLAGLEIESTSHTNSSKHAAAEEPALYSTVRNKKMDHLLRENFYLSNQNQNSPSKSVASPLGSKNGFDNYELNMEQNGYFDPSQQSFNNHEHDEDIDEMNGSIDGIAKSLFAHQLKIVEEVPVGPSSYYDELIASKRMFEQSSQAFGTKSVLSSATTTTMNTITTSTTAKCSLMPSKNAVIKKMKKITKSVQDLFKATKESEFHLYVLILILVLFLFFL
jgi:hypothetical protein